MDTQLSEKLALVTGSTGGIGLAIAKSLVKENASVIINGRSQESVDNAIAQIASEGKGKVMGLAADLSTVEGVEKATERYPQLDILVNNLGIYEAKSFTDITDEDWQNMFNINVMSGIRLSRAYFPKMLNNNWGRIIFISSDSAVQIPPEMIHYGMTKAAQVSIARGLAELTVNTSVTVNSILAGPTKTKGVEEFIQQKAEKDNITVEEVEKNFFEDVRPGSLTQKFSDPEEIANLVTYVVSPLASSINGAALRIEGGLLKSAL